MLTATDWDTYGFDLHRSGENTAESALGAGNVTACLPPCCGRRHSAAISPGSPWSRRASPSAEGPQRRVRRRREGRLHGVDESTGAILWQHNLGTVHIPNCYDAINGVFGIGGAATINRATNTVYVAVGDEQCTRSTSAGHRRRVGR